MDYDEDAVLTKYIWDHYTHLLTDDESHVARAVFAKEKEAVASSPKMASRIRDKWGVPDDDPVVMAELADGVDAFRRRVRDRIVADHPKDVSINRCGQCHCVVCTPLAQQCLWCGHDWHSV
jgi:hypothetical protein